MTGTQQHRAGPKTTTLLSAALRSALTNDELVVHHQAVVDLADGTAAGTEALVRWDHPICGLVPPAEFIPIAEESDLILDVGAFVLRQACADLAGWGLAHADQSVAVNISARQLAQPGLVAAVADALLSSGVAPTRLVLEVTERVLLDAAVWTPVLAELREVGVRIAIDDFGTGYSSLSCLQHLPVDILKVDRSFVQRLGAGPSSATDRALVAAVIDLAHGLGLTTIAEGVETEEQLACLRELGCDHAQGYLWGRPVPAGAAREQLEQICASTTATDEGHEPEERSVLVIDDERAVRELVAARFDAEDGYRAVAATGDGRRAIALASHHRPDIVVLDLAMPGLGGLEVLPGLRASVPKARIMVLSGLDDPTLEAAACRAGAEAYVVKGGAAVDHLVGLVAAGRP